jgi:hypothetical protein
LILIGTETVQRSFALSFPHGFFIASILKDRKNLMRSPILGLSLLVSIAVATPLSAQMSGGAQNSSVRSNTTGLHLGLGLNGSAQRIEDYDAESGGGLALRIGYGFSPLVTVFLASEGAWMPDDEYALGHGDLGVRLNFSDAANNLRPYIDAALSSRVMQDDDFQVSGLGATLGGGLQVFFSAPVALDVGLKWTYGQYNTVRDRQSGVSVTNSDGINASSARFNIGLSWYPMARR